MTRLLFDILARLTGRSWRRSLERRMRETVPPPNVRCQRRHPGWQVPL